MKIRKAGLGGLLAIVLGALPLGATSIGAGGFGLTGTFYVNTTGPIQFYLNTLGDTKSLVQGPTSGAYLGTNTPFPQEATIANLPPTFGTVSVVPWITLSDGITLAATSIVLQTSVMYPICSDTAADNLLAGCTVYGDPGILLTEKPTGVTATVSVNGIAYTGSSSTGSTPFTALLTSDFAQQTPSIYGLEQEFSAQGFIQNPYSASIIDTAAVPEPATLASLGFGMLLVGLIGRKKLNKRS